jgi:disulfide oxidoreductase YuzD
MTVTYVQPPRSRHYYVVGATDDDTNENLFKTFIDRGYWHLTWPEDHPKAKKYIDIRNGMQRGDRIAIKKLNKKSEFDQIVILATGIVKDYDPETKRVYIDWVKSDYNRKVPSRGCYAAAHGPYYVAESTDIELWLGKIFRL